MANKLDGFEGASAATFAADVEQAIVVNFWISIVLFISVIAPMLYFAWKYRENNVKDEDEGAGSDLRGVGVTPGGMDADLGDMDDFEADEGEDGMDDMEGPGEVDAELP